MDRVFFTPGPSQLYPTVPQHIRNALDLGICSISHRSEDFRKIFLKAQEEVRGLMGFPKDIHVFFLGSGTEAMERIIESCVAKQSFHFVNGSFSKRFYQTAIELGRKSQKMDAPLGEGFDFGSAQIPQGTELLCFTQNETSTGVAIPVEDIYSLREKNPGLLVAVDVVSSAPYTTVDFSKADCAFFSVQKGFGLPAGIGVVAVKETAIDKARALQKQGASIGSYHSFLSLLDQESKYQTPETPNVLGIYLLGKVCEDLTRYGAEKIRKETEEKAALLYDFCESHPSCHGFVKEKRWRSNTIIVAEIPRGSAPLIKNLKESGMVVGSGYGELKERQIRVANFPAHSREQVRRLLEGIGAVD